MKKTKIFLLIISVLLLSGCSLFEFEGNNNSNSNFKTSQPKSTVIPTPTSSATPTPTPKNNRGDKVGTEVTVKGEPFYIFDDSDSNNIVLFAKYNLTKDGKKQAPDAMVEETKVEFSSEVYWEAAAKNYNDWDNKKFDLNTINGNKSGDAITKARDYAKALGAIEGRLITYEEVDSLREDYPVMIGGHDNNPPNETGDKYLNYYTASVRSFNIYKVYMVRGHSTPTIEVDSALYGVRPIITISKSLIDK